GDTPELRSGSNEARMQVNLSACGIAFYTDEPLQAERFMLLNMQLKPSNASLSLAGDIVSVKEVNHDRGRYQVRVNFDSMKEADQDMLIQHLFNLQSLTRRQQRAGDRTTAPYSQVYHELRHPNLFASGQRSRHPAATGRQQRHSSAARPADD